MQCVDRLSPLSPGAVTMLPSFPYHVAKIGPTKNRPCAGRVDTGLFRCLGKPFYHYHHLYSPFTGASGAGPVNRIKRRPLMMDTEATSDGKGSKHTSLTTM
eukprot:588816-Pelagomonas_calceolata.AAC.5